MMASRNAHLKSESLKQLAEFAEIPPRIALRIAQPLEQFLLPAHARRSLIDDEAGGMETLRPKSMKLTGYLQFLIESNRQSGSDLTVIAPREHNERGYQLSILAHDHPKELFKKLEAAGVKCDFCEPNVIRAAPTPLYNTFHEVWRFAQILGGTPLGFA